MKRTEVKKAERTGRSMTLLFILLGLGVAALILGGTLPLLAWEFPFYTLLVSFGLFGSGFLFGGILGKWILLKKGSPSSYGILCSLIVLSIGTSFLVLANFILVESLEFQDPDAVEDYIYKPIAAVFFYGSIPTIILGALLGWAIKKLGERKIAKGSG